MEYKPVPPKESTAGKVCGSATVWRLLKMDPKQ
jgi:hypothetical protein